MKRKLNAQPALPNLYFRIADGVLSVPGYTFDKVKPVVDDSMFLKPPCRHSNGTILVA